jgi:hypothetical protein
MHKPYAKFLLIAVLNSIAIYLMFSSDIGRGVIFFATYAVVPCMCLYKYFTRWRACDLIIFCAYYVLLMFVSGIREIVLCYCGFLAINHFRPETSLTNMLIVYTPCVLFIYGSSGNSGVSF